MKHPFVLVPIVGILLLIAASTSPAQRIIRSLQGDSLRTMRFNGDSVAILPEIGGVATQHGHDVRIDHVQSPELRMQAYRDVDVRQGDLLLLCNGKRVKTAAALRESYHAIPVGKTVKIGLQRGDQLVTVTFVKADPKDLPSLRIIQRKK